VEDGEAVARANQPEQDHHPGRDRDGRLIFAFFIGFQIATPPRAT
jgi:hypothetical protein